MKGRKNIGTNEGNFSVNVYSEISHNNEQTNSVNTGLTNEAN